MSFNKYKQLYSTFLFPFILYSGSIGSFGGIISHDHSKNSHNLFINIIGHTSIGIITGIFYPITYPLLGYYVLYKKKD